MPKKAKIKVNRLVNLQAAILPPPPPPKAPPPPPPRKVATPVQFTLPLPDQPPRATHLRWQSANKGTTLEVPIAQYGDFSSFKTGTLSWGRIHSPGGEWEALSDDVGRQSAVEVRAEQHAPRPPGPPPPPGSKPVATKPVRQPRAAGTGPKKEGVCSFIDARIMEGGRTVEQVLALVMAQFPGRDPVATTSTIKTRPSHIKAKGLVPPAFAK